MLTELNSDSQINDPLALGSSSSSSILNLQSSGMAAYPPPQEENTTAKRMKTWCESEFDDIILPAVARRIYGNPEETIDSSFSEILVVVEEKRDLPTGKEEEEREGEKRKQLWLSSRLGVKFVEGSGSV